MKQELINLRKAMEENGIDFYIITSEDDHMSEYPANHFYSKKYVSGFTGSAGSLLVSKDHAGLWVDSRYYVQARKQLEGSGFILHESTHENLSEIADFIFENMASGQIVGMDASTISFIRGKKLLAKISGKGGSLKNIDLMEQLWAERPELPAKPVWNLELKYSGKSTADKLSEIRKEMSKAGAEMHILSRLDDIAWLSNLRGSDVLHTPVFYSYMIIEQNNAYLYAMEKAFPEDVLSVLSANGVTLRAYNTFLSDAEKLSEGKTVLLDPAGTSFALYQALKKAKINEAKDPSVLMKSVKNAVEIENLKEANIKDGAAMVNFIYWVKNTIGKEKMTEMDASDYVDKCRYDQGAFDLSFTTIAAYEGNAAMCHYSPTPEEFSDVEPCGFLLVDSGGCYKEGATDITRTIVVGPITNEERRSFTLVLKGMIDLAMAEFPEGTTGFSLDAIARKPLWACGYDFGHGTGHGIGYSLSVHEGPQNISPRIGSIQPFIPGMLTSDEPGIYIENKYGIRHEIDILCVEKEATPFGKFYGFETLTLCPIDLDAVDAGMLSCEEKAWLNDYHKMVYEKLSPRLDKDKAAWLKEATREI